MICAQSRKPVASAVSASGQLAWHQYVRHHRVAGQALAAFELRRFRAWLRAFTLRAMCAMLLVMPGMQPHEFRCGGALETIGHPTEECRTSWTTCTTSSSVTDAILRRDPGWRSTSYLSFHSESAKS